VGVTLRVYSDSEEGEVGGEEYDDDADEADGDGDVGDLPLALDVGVLLHPLLWFSCLALCSLSHASRSRSSSSCHSSSVYISARRWISPLAAPHDGTDLERNRKRCG